ncbi:hypothetical protein [Actinoplanes utahensis]|nr:hypothetical protein [Actinoplanes utahensis]
MSLLMAVSAVSAGVGGLVAVSGAGLPATGVIDAAFDRRTAPTPALTRGGVLTSPAPTATSAPAPKSARYSKPAPSAKAARPPKPVAGLNQAQMSNAATIVRLAQERDLPRRAMLIAVMTAFQESSLRNLANSSVPASLDRPHQGVGDDFDSVGLFQQRPSQGWGTVAQLMDPRYAADAFYDRLVEIPDWESLSLGDAAQAVQRSAVPDAYADHEDRAIRIVDALS